MKIMDWLIATIIVLSIGIYNLDRFTRDYLVY